MFAWAGLLALALLPARAQPAPAFQHAAALENVTYAGTLPCADCGGQQIVLTLFADQTFRMRTRYLGVRSADTSEINDLGRWGSPDAVTLELQGGRDGPLRFSRQPGDALRMLDALGLPIVSVLNYELARQAHIDRLDGPVRLRGMYLITAETPSLTECLTGNRWPVLPKGEHLAMKQAYLAQRGQLDKPVLAVMTASFDWRKPETGGPSVESLHIEAFERLWSSETCAADAPAAAALLNTRWRVVEIDGQPVRLVPGRHEPYAQLSSAGNQVRGFGGCNAFSGGFEQGSDGMRFLRLVSTRKSCPGDVLGQEGRLLAALEATASRRVVGDTLQLRDAQGTVRLRFEALYLR